MFDEGDSDARYSTLLNRVGVSVSAAIKKMLTRISALENLRYGTISYVPGLTLNSSVCFKDSQGNVSIMHKITRNTELTSGFVVGTIPAGFRPPVTNPPTSVDCVGLYSNAGPGVGASNAGYAQIDPATGSISVFNAAPNKTVTIIALYRTVG
ncbi:hypothetical protein [Mycetocola saprophilus]|uniref:hypothetical protein n=1 Tax=Mycetocola saprophilus TaxID=76636 RepID=UPI003BF3B1D7